MAEGEVGAAGSGGGGDNSKEEEGGGFAWESEGIGKLVFCGDVDGVKEILLADKDVVHYLNKSRRSPLYLAVVNANVQILNLLLKIPFRL